MVIKQNDNRGLLDKEFLYFMAAVAIAAIFALRQGWTAAELIGGTVVFVIAEHFVSWRLHQKKIVRTLLSLEFASWTFFLLEQVAHAFTRR